ncbi:MAG TPA: DUF4058 family protein [Humisphaera sp.]|jgi:hypothetical protein|nr:DUF4058 family protein [Humisphaera sp.]
MQDFCYNRGMPIHDWTRVTAGTYHDFHMAWIAELRRALNGGLLPEGYYALAEQVANQVIPDVLTLQDLSGVGGSVSLGEDEVGQDSEDGGVAVAVAPPRVSVKDTISEAMLLAARRRRLVIRHTTGDRIVALLEIVSPGNKEKRSTLDTFVDKAVGALEEGYHLLVIDILPPGPADPAGMHGAIWQRLGGKFDLPAAKPLTLAAYVSAGPVTCYVEPTAIGTALIPMPLFLDPGHYVNVPLEATYLSAYEGVPRRWKRVIEGQSQV